MSQGHSGISDIRSQILVAIIILAVAVFITVGIAALGNYYLRHERPASLIFDQSSSSPRRPLPPVGAVPLLVVDVR